MAVSSSFSAWFLYGFPYRFQRARTVLCSTKHPLDVVRVGTWNNLTTCLPRMLAWKAAGVGVQVASFMVNSHNSLWINTFILMHLSCWPLWWFWNSGAKLCRGKRISILCDNIESVMVLNRGITRDKFQAQCLREITFITAVGEFQVRTQHILGTENIIPDILSWWHSFQNPFLKLQKLKQGFELSETVVDIDCFQFSSEWWGCPELKFYFIKCKFLLAFLAEYI